jgi:hypothetical protein
MGKGAILIGIGLIIFGIWLGFKIYFSSASNYILIYSLFSIGIGIAMIVLYKEEGKIEERKDLKRKTSKK